MKINKNSKLFLKILSGVVGVVLWFAITYTEDPIISQSLGDIKIVFDGEKQLMDICNRNGRGNLRCVKNLHRRRKSGRYTVCVPNISDIYGEDKNKGNNN